MTVRDDSQFGYSKKTGKLRRRCRAQCRSVGNDIEKENRRGRRCRNYICNCEHCRTYCVQDKFCHHHKRRSRLGPLSPLWKGGVTTNKNDVKFLTAIPKHLTESLARLSENPDLLKSHDEIVLLDVRTEELLSQLSSDAIPENWSKADELVDDILRALEDMDGDRAVRMLTQLKRLTSSANDSADEIWKDIRETIEQRRKVVDTERRIIESEQVHLRPDKLLLIATQISKLVREFLGDEEYDQFSEKFRELFYQPDLVNVEVKPVRKIKAKK